MPRYFFHIYDSAGILISVHQGKDIADELEAVRQECHRIIREVLLEENWPEATSGRYFRITDERGHTIQIEPFTAPPPKDEPGQSE
jgi:hypothetical protein